MISYIAAAVFIIVWYGATYFIFRKGAAKKPVPHCELSEEQARELIDLLQRNIAWHKVYKDHFMVDLTTRELQLIIDCLEHSHKRENNE